MRPRDKIWLAAVLLCLAALVAGAWGLQQSFRLTAFSDIIQCLLLLSGTLAFSGRALNTKGRMRLFWSLMSLGLALWLAYQLLWTYFEVVLRIEVPDLFFGDIVLFVHLVPLIAAIALRPHVPRDQYAARLGHLDFALLLVWWVYLYVLLVMAWMYASPDPVHYGDNLNAVYLAEKVFFLAALAACWATSKGGWKLLYANLFAASFMYAISSYIANWALNRNVYYSGSLYDIPLAGSMAWVTVIALFDRPDEPETSNARTSSSYGVWVARSGMIAAFSLPIVGAWTLFDTGVPSSVLSFRITLTLTTALVMGIMVFLRQRLLDNELKRLLDQSRESFDNLKRLQAQILQSERVASIGLLVGGAAHELNNPITAMLGYSDLLLSTQLSPEQQTAAALIGQQVRKTKSLVASLLSFARRAPAAKSPVDLNTLARTALKLSEPECRSMKIEILTEFDANLPKVLGDSNQLLQVCLQVLANSMHARGEPRGGRLLLTTRSTGASCVLTVEHSTAPTGTGAAPALPADMTDAMGLAACRGIVEEHQGQISYQGGQEGGSTVRIELPCAVPDCEKASPVRAKVSRLWQFRPFA